MDTALSDLPNKAADFFSRDFNCAQSVLAAFAGQLGLAESDLLKLASPFGGGVARRGHICGAVSGGLMVLGLAQGADHPSGKEAAYKLGQEFLRQFSPGMGPSCAETCWVMISAPMQVGRRAKKAYSKRAAPNS